FIFTQQLDSVIYPLSLHDALPIFPYYSRHIAKFKNKFGQLKNYTYLCCMKSNKIYVSQKRYNDNLIITVRNPTDTQDLQDNSFRSEEHTSELQSRENIVCRLLLEK